MAHGTEQPRKTGRAKYFSPGPKPRTERGKRRHAERNQDQQKHASNVHVDRESWIAAQSFTPSGLGRAKI